MRLRYAGLICLVVLFSHSAAASWWDSERYPDQYTRALWHFNDNTGVISDDAGIFDYDLNVGNDAIWDDQNKKFGDSSISPKDTYFATGWDSESGKDQVFDVVPEKWTISAWLAPMFAHDATVLTTEQWFNICGSSCASEKIDCSFPSSSGYLRCYIETGGTTYAVQTTTVSWTANSWYNFQFDYNGYAIGLRVNGILQSSAYSVNFPSHVDNNINIGAAFGGSNRSYFRVDEMEIATTDRNTNPPGFLSEVSDLNSIFFVRNSTSSAGIPDINIVVKKNVPGFGLVTVNNVVTDSAGEAKVSFVANTTYYLTFINDQNVIVYTSELRPNFTSYQVYLDLEKITTASPISTNVDVNFIPNYGILFIRNGFIDLNQRITSSYSDLNARVLITNAGRIVYDLNLDGNSGSLFFWQNLKVDYNINRLSSIKVDVLIDVNGGWSATFSKTYTAQDLNSLGSQLFSSLINVFPRELGGTGIILFSVLLIIAIVGLAASQIGGDPKALGLIAVMTGGLLAYIGWIPIIVFGGMAASWLALFLLLTRVEY